jgi:hypothetical protein
VLCPHFSTHFTKHRPVLSSERSPYMKNKESNCHSDKCNIWSPAPKGARHQDELADWPSVVMWLLLRLYDKLGLLSLLSTPYVAPAWTAQKTPFLVSCCLETAWRIPLSHVQSSTRTTQKTPLLSYRLRATALNCGVTTVGLYNLQLWANMPQYIGTERLQGISFLLILNRHNAYVLWSSIFFKIPFYLQAVQIHSANSIKLLEAWRGVLSSTPPYK